MILTVAMSWFSLLMLWLVLLLSVLAETAVCCALALFEFVCLIRCHDNQNSHFLR